MALSTQQGCDDLWRCQEYLIFLDYEGPNPEVIGCCFGVPGIEAQRLQRFNRDLILIKVVSRISDVLKREDYFASCTQENNPLP